MNEHKRLTIRVWTYYAVALAVVVGTVVLGTILQRAEAGTPTCATRPEAHRIHEGMGRTTVERQLTGRAVARYRDPITVLVTYRGCADGARVYVFYWRRADHPGAGHEPARTVTGPVWWCPSSGPCTEL